MMSDPFEATVAGGREQAWSLQASRDRGWVPEGSNDREGRTTSAATAGAQPRRRSREPKSVSYFVSSPGAISSEERDASTQQGKFGILSLLQAQLRQDLPSLICDLNSGKVLTSNPECER